MEPNTTDLVYNLTVLANNETVNQVTRYFNISISNLTNQSVETQAKLFDLYEMYKTKEREQLMVYKFVAYVIGTLIIISNLTVVISSGLILKKGQQPKSTYLLLGNVSLADTIVGISIIFGTIVDNNMTSNPLCIFQIGMLVCPAMVSIFSVGFIAIDRYFYILHGLYYQRYFNTTKVRIGIVCIWMVGITLGFMPVTGWVNQELHYTRCYYVGLFPGSLILLNSFLSIVPIIVVAILYSIILVKALSNVNKIKGIKKSVKLSDPEKPKLRIYRGNGNAQKVDNSYSVKYPAKSMSHCNKLKRSASFNIHEENKPNKPRTIKSKSISDLIHEEHQNTELNKAKSSSEFSVYTIDSSDPNFSNSSEVSGKSNGNDTHENKKKRKSKEPKKWRAITIVMLTSGSFIVTWMPFFTVVIFFVFCQQKLTNPKCLEWRTLLGGPIAALAFTNSILNPLIYAWWHKGFQRSVKAYYRKYVQKYFYTNTKL